VAVLLVEDNARLSASLARGLGECGLPVEAVRTGLAAIQRLTGRCDADAVILDLGLPDVDGLEVLRAARDAGVIVPVLVLTARDAVRSRVEALDRGADDYLVKPFAFEELVARVRALVRRAAAPRWGALAFGDLRVDPASPVVRAAGKEVSLSPRQHTLLSHLVRRGADTTTRAEILAEVFGYDFDPGTNLIDVHIAHLRRKLAASTTKIETVRGMGFRLRADGQPGDVGA